MTDPDRRLEHAIRQLGADLEPPPGWEARVLAAVEPRRRRGWARGWDQASVCARTRSASQV